MSTVEHSSPGLADPLSVADRIALSRIVGTAEAAAYCGFGVQHWRHLVREGKAPAPVKLNARRFGWKMGTLIAFNDARAA